MQLELATLNLPKVSEAGMRILDVLAKDEYSINDIAEVVAEDPTLSGMMLKYANSPLYRRSQEITSVRNAISLLGVKNVKLVVTLAAMRSFSEGHSIIVEKLWEHAFTIALISKEIANLISRVLADEMEFTGIIHDISSMTLAANYPKACDELFKQVTLEVGLDQLEADYFTLSYEELIGWVAQSLHMPEMTVDAIKRLYQGEFDASDGAGGRQATILALAHHIDQKLHEDDLLVIRQHLLVNEMVESLYTSLGLSEAQLQEVIEVSREKLSERFVF